MQRNVEIIINTSELTAGTRGASLGPAAIMTAARKQNNNFFGKIPLHPLPDFNTLIDQPTSTLYAKRIDGYESVFYAIAEKTIDLLKTDRFPLILAADHGSAAGTIAGICAHYPNKKLGVVWIDAHGDLHSPLTTPSGNMHGMPLALSLGNSNLDQAKNDVDAHSLEKWNSMVGSYGKHGKIAAENLVFVGVRDTEPEEDYLIENLQITNHTVETVRRLGVKAVIDQINEQLNDCDIIYVSFDVDSMDPEVTSFGTGTPVGNGLFPEEATEILTLLAQNPKTVCMEFVEVNPCLDNKLNTMAETTFSILEKVVEAL
ncbi:MAG: arginase [Fluviicola sp.]|nr:arginase [Fluviicola sp.]